MSGLRVGSIGYLHHRGLGILLKEFLDNGIVDTALVVEHSKVPRVKEWYPNLPTTDHRHFDCLKAFKLVDDVDVLLLFETPFDNRVMEYAKRKGKLVDWVTMYECTQTNHPTPTRYLCPSLVDVQSFTPYSTKFNTPLVRVQVPIADELIQRPKTRFSGTFVHTAGYFGMLEREGTSVLVSALEVLNQRNIVPTLFTIRSQERIESSLKRRLDNIKWVEYQHTTIERENLFKYQDVAVFPQRFNGLSYPIMEALASGTTVVTTETPTMKEWVPALRWIQPERVLPGRIGGSYFKIDVYEPSVIDLALKLSEIIGQVDGLDNFREDFVTTSQEGVEWTKKNSWSVLKQRWINLVKHRAPSFALGGS